MCHIKVTPNKVNISKNPAIQSKVGRAIDTIYVFNFTGYLDDLPFLHVISSYCTFVIIVA